jgi:hypothetical protein
MLDVTQMSRSVPELLLGSLLVKLALLSTYVSPGLFAGGSVAFTGAQGSMQNKRQVVVQLKKGSDGLVPDFSLVLASPSAACREVKLEWHKPVKALQHFSSLVTNWTL